MTMTGKKVLYGVLGVALLAGPASRYIRGQMSADAPRVQGQNPNGMHIYMWGGLKSHGEGAHDYPHFFADWSEVLTDHGAVVDGALHPPSEADLAHTDVVLIYKGDAGYLSDQQKTIFENYVKRGGGIVSIHDSLCGPDPAWFAQTLVGGGKKHGEQNSAHDLQMHYQINDKDSPILKDWNDLTFPDEAFFLMTWAKEPAIHVLTSVTIAGNGPHKGEVVPQMWTWEHTLPGGKPARAFVWMQGHTYENFSNPVIQKTLLRGIAWAGQKPYDELVAYVPPPSLGRGGRGRGARGGSGGRGAAAQ
ncbi:MAG TPA: ThuA domain-containing protein [Bryobacteraceae bacterium]|nr:ThuA domain-containing protein [Bryobacteraceae bacterium]